MSLVLGDTKEEEAPLIANHRPNVAVQVSVRTGVRLDCTVKAYLDSDDERLQEEGMYFLRRLFALLVIQFSAILVIVSPFCLMESFQQIVMKYRTLIGPAAFLGLLVAIIMALTDTDVQKNSSSSVSINHPQHRRSWIAVYLLTFCVAVSLGVKLIIFPAWSKYALVALGQATTNFAILLSIFQFDRKNLYWLNYKTSGLICFGIGLVWMMILAENGESWRLSAGIALGGWLYAVNIIMGARSVMHHRSPDDYVRGTLFVLGPRVPDAVMKYLREKCGRVSSSSSSSSQEEEDGHEVLGRTDYGTVV